MLLPLLANLDFAGGAVVAIPDQDLPLTTSYQLQTRTTAYTARARSTDYVAQIRTTELN